MDGSSALSLIAVTVDGATTHFIYDGDGNLIKQIKPDGSRTLYVGGVYEVTKNSGGAVTGTKTYYPAAGAMRDGSTLYYMLKDHLGSASVLTNASGATVPGAETRYYPFGEERFTGPMVTDRLFTGQRQIAELGIYHYGARFYSPKLGRFLSADTIVPSYTNPQHLNRFSYVTNNPLRYIDPTGHFECESDGDECLTENQVTQREINDLNRKKNKPDDDEDDDGGGDKPKPSPSSLNSGIECPSYYQCVTLSHSELSNLDNMLYWIEGTETAVLGVASVATLPEGLLLALVGTWEVGDLLAVQDQIDNAVPEAANSGSVSLQVNPGILGDAYHLPGNYEEAVITAPLARRVMNAVFSYYTIKHWIFGAP